MKNTLAHASRRIAAACLGAFALAACAAQAKVYDQVEIAPQAIDGLVPGELSGLAWDADEQLLYAVFDRGLLFHFKLTLDGTRLREVKAAYAAPLLPADGTAGGGMNAEALAVIGADNGKRGDTQLVVALENGPSLMRFSPQGKAQGEVTLPAALRDPGAYRGGNKGLESVAVLAKHGFVTAPQSPLRSQPENVHRVYATDGSEWAFAAGERGAIKGIETLSDGSLLVLERQGKGKAVTPVLHRIDPAACASGTTCGSTIALAGVAPGDNYEGLARLSDKLFLIVSDDGGNGKRPTRLVLFGLDGS